MRLLLYIDNKWTEPEMSADANNGISMTYTYDSLINPADYVSEYSLTFKLPKTEHNNRLFDEFRYLDSTIGHFKPQALMNYQLTSDENDIISRGTCYLNTIDDNYYNLNLSGSLSYVFKRMLNCGWDTKKASEDSSYTLLPEYLKWSGLGYTNKVLLNKELVKTSWDTDNITYDWDALKNQMVLRPFMGRGMTKNQFVSNCIGFAPSFQGKYKDFSSDKWVRKPSNWYYPVVRDVLDCYESKSIPDEGIIDRQICEYRSYYQTPYIYMSRLWQWVESEFKNITGYDLFLDDKWFNINNPYYRELVYTLPCMYNSDDAKQYDNHNTDIEPISKNMPLYTAVDGDYKSSALSNIKLTHYSETINNSDPTRNVEYKYQFNLKYKRNSSGSLFWSSVMGVDYYLMYNLNNPLIVTMKLTNGTTDYATKTYLILPCSNLQHNGEYVYKPNEQVVGLYSQIVDEVIEYYYKPKRFTEFTDEVDFGSCQLNLKYSGIVNNAYVKTEIAYGNTYSPFRYYKPWYTTYNVYPTCPTGSQMYTTNTFKMEVDGVYQLIVRENKRSNLEVTLEKLFKGTSPFEVLLKYTKMLNLIWLCDDYNRKVTVMSRYQHFYKCIEEDMGAKTPSMGDADYKGFLDLTDLVDMSKGMEVQSPSWENHTVEFNYDDCSADYYSQYKDKYGKSYGGKTIVTENEKNTETKNLFATSDYDKINPSCTNSEWLITINNMLNDNNYKVESKPLISNSTGEVWNNFYFRNTNGDWNDGINDGWRKDEGGSFVRISDDTQTEVFSDIYCWQTSESGNTVKTYVRPRLNTATTNDSHSVWFAVPREIYHQYPYNDGMVCVYDHCWKDFIEDVYNVNNKKVVCYIQLDAKSYRRLKINPLVQIKNCIYLMTKIEGWSEETEKCKCTLVQISDIFKLSSNKIKKIKVLDSLWEFDNGDVIAFDDGTEIRINN